MEKDKLRKSSLQKKPTSSDGKPLPPGLIPIAFIQMKKVPCLGVADCTK